ncbi:MAG: quinolinate synthase NadA [Cyclobacteriaceae bacterium]|nr:quinolinate synthase NadA [Cyclobacteriaceae bacterium]
MEALDVAKKNLEDAGYLNLPVENIDLVKEINRLKKEKNAVILAHFYQEPAIQDIADHLGDSLYLARKAAETDADMIVFAGVHFMAETAKILNPDKKVLLPDLHAGCSLADSCPAVDFKAFIDQHPDHYVISYINCSAEVKALSDIICTSSNALQIVRSLPEDQPIIFAPDKHLGEFVMKQTGRDMLLWDGACLVHEAFSIEKILNLIKENPNAKVIAHPESETHILKVASYVGSTTGLLNYVQEDDHNEFIIATEHGIIHQMKKKVKNKKLIPAPINQNNACACSECEFMKMNTMEKLYLCMKYELPEITIPQDLMKKALAPIERMLAVK